MTYRIGFYGCAHLGYRMRGMSRTSPNGINIKENDGYIAHRLIMRDMLEHGVNGIVDGGDLFHVEHPAVRPVATALAVDDLRVEHTPRPWRITNGGNHDNGAATRLSAVAHIHRTELDCHAVYPDASRDAAQQVGPWPGLYEVHQPDPTQPVFIHVVSHNGLDPALADRGITIDPTPRPGAVNILVSHGIFSADGRLFGADDAHGARRVIPETWVGKDWDQTILSDYHTLGPIPGFEPDTPQQRGQVWMTGSGVRRGFSDEACDRGWIEVAIDGDPTTGTARTTVTPHTIWQRPQVDFQPIEARGLTAADIDARIRNRIKKTALWDDPTAELTGDGGVIVRQTIQHSTPQQRSQLAEYRVEWQQLADRAAFFSVDYIDNWKPETPTATTDPKNRKTLVDEFIDRQKTGEVGKVMKPLAENDPDLHKTVFEQVKKTLETIH